MTRPRRAVYRRRNPGIGAAVGACLGLIFTMLVACFVMGLLVTAAVNVLFDLNWGVGEGMAAVFLLSIITGALRRN